MSESPASPAHTFPATIDFIRAQAALPDGTAAATEVPEAVSLELGAAGIGIGTLFQLLPLLLELFKNPQLQALIAQILAALKPAG